MVARYAFPRGSVGTRQMVHLLFADDCIRLISARKATHEERLIYEDQ
jgi:uncharacterized DUF497 family protein